MNLSLIKLINYKMLIVFFQVGYAHLSVAKRGYKEKNDRSRPGS